MVYLNENARLLVEHLKEHDEIPLSDGPRKRFLAWFDKHYQRDFNEIHFIEEYPILSNDRYKLSGLSEKVYLEYQLLVDELLREFYIVA